MTKPDIMPFHIVKLCVDCSSIEELVAWIDCELAQKKAQGAVAEVIHTTRMVPRRIVNLAEETSLYWVIKGKIQCRQRLLAIRPYISESGINRCHLVLEPKVIATQWQPRRAFQGWRYLKAEDAPLDDNDNAKHTLPAFLRQELADLGLL